MDHIHLPTDICISTYTHIHAYVYTYDNMYKQTSTDTYTRVCMFVIECLLLRQHCLRSSQVMYTVKEYMQTVTAVDPYWLAECVTYHSPV